jgi:hypothetical protein
MEIKGSSHSNHQNVHIAMVTRNMNMHVDIFLRMHTVGKISKCNQDIVETTNINIHDRLCSWLGICTLMKHNDGCQFVISILLGDGWITVRTSFYLHTSLSPIRRGFPPGFVNYKKGALDSQVIKYASCLPMVGGSLRVLRLRQPPKLVAMI